MDDEKLKELAEKFAQEFQTSAELQKHHAEHERRIERARNMLTPERAPNLTEEELRELFYDTDSLNFWGNKDYGFSEPVQRVGLDGIRNALRELAMRGAKGLTIDDLKHILNTKALGPVLTGELLTYLYPDRYWTYSRNVTFPAFQVLGEDVEASLPRGQRNEASRYMALRPLLEQVRRSLQEAGLTEADNLTADIFLWWVKQSNPDVGKYWLFQANPEKFDLAAALEEATVGTEDEWTVSAYRNEMKQGDKVIFWLAGSQSGIYALGELIDEVRQREQKPTQEEINERPYLKNEWTIKYRYTHILDEPIMREALKDHPILRDLAVMKFANATNFRVTPEQWAAVEALIDDTEIIRTSGGDDQSIREFVEKFLPADETIRRACLNAVADSIVHAHQHGKGSWVLTPRKKGFIQLNVGNHLTIRLAAKTIYIFLNREQVSEEVYGAIERYLIDRPDWRYARIKDSFAIGLPTEMAAELWPSLKEANFKFVEDAIKQISIAPTAKKHSSALVASLREFLNRPEIPDPVYPPTAERRKEPPIQPSIDILETISRSCAARGLHFTKWQIAAFYTALQVKGFVILSGISGTGKTKLAQHFAAILPQPSYDKTVTPGDTVSITVQPYMLKYNRLIIPKQATRLFDPPPPGEALEVSLIFDGQKQDCRLVHAVYGNSDYISLMLRGAARQWFGDHLSEGDTLVLEPELDGEQKLTGMRLMIAKGVDEESPVIASGHNWLFVSVRPDWRDSKSLLGYYNPLIGTYEWTPFLRFLLRAVQSYRSEDGLAWFVIVDEMNLAHVEYYFADLLSVMESGRDEDGWTREPLRLNYPDDAEGDLPPRELYLPPNIYFVGTVNIDETTHAFSPKVLDRAFTLELTEADFTDYLSTNSKEHADLRDADRAEILNDFTYDGWYAFIDKEDIANCLSEHPELRTQLQTLNELLRPYNLHFGYRVFDEIVAYIDWAEHTKIFTDIGGLDAAFDAAVLMKVLPKFHGSRGRLEAPLRAVLAWCVNPDVPARDSIADALRQVESGEDIAMVLDRVTFKYSATADRAKRMLRSLYTDGFAAFG